MMAHRLSGFLVVGICLGFAACGGDSITIPPTTGTLEITTATTGSEPDPDGYTLQVDTQQPQVIGSAATVRIDQLAPGPHSVLLSGLAANCTVSDNPRTVNIVVGETSSALFELSCGATRGALEVTAQTNGPVPDADGYAVSFDGIETGPIGTNAAVTLNNLSPGSHVVGLSGISGNCHMEGDNLRAVIITAGETSTVTFTVTCVEPPPNVGVLRVTTTTAGQDQDADGYELRVDGGQSQPIGVNAATSLDNIAAGTHTVVLSNVAANCSVAGGSSKDVSITPGATTTVAFSVACAALPPINGTIRVTTTTSGPDQDSNGYAFTVDGGPSQAIGVNAAVSLANVAPGSHAVELTGVAGNCSVADGTTRNISVTAGAISEVSFAITCTAVPSASRSDVSVDPDNFVAGTGSSTITVTIKDARGNRMSGVTVTPTSDGTGNEFTPTSTETDANGVATFEFRSTDAGDKTITVVAGGVTLEDERVITVVQATSTTEIISHELNPSTAGDPIHVTFTVTGGNGGTPTGTVTIYSLQEQEAGCTVEVAEGSCDVTLSVLGHHTLGARYSGDSQFEDSFDEVDHEVVAALQTN
jgi:hypothetical protein